MTPVLALSEAAFQRRVLDAAAYHGWHPYHTYDSRRSHPGWPDLVLARPPRLVAVELKTDAGRLSPAQREWLVRLEACGLEVDVWRPRDWDEVVRPALAGVQRCRGAAVHTSPRRTTRGA